MVSRTLATTPFAVGNTATAYRRTGGSILATSAPPGQSAVDTATVAASTGVTFDGLAGDTAYWAIGQDPAGVWRWVAFATEEELDADRARPVSRRLDLLEAEVELGDWTPVTFANSWVNYDPQRPVEYRLVGREVFLRGLAKDGVVGLGTPITTLPVAPTGNRQWPVVSDDDFGVVVVTTAGAVSLLVGSNVYVDLGAVRFYID